MKTRKLFGLGVGFLVIVGLTMLSSPVWAGEKKHGGKDNPPPDIGDCVGVANCNTISPEGGRGGDGYGGEGGSATGGAGGDANAMGGEATANTGPIDNSSGGGNSTVSTRSSNTNVVLVPNNNTAGCLRVYGLSFGNGDGAAALGIPTRDKACDYEAAADDAASTGDHDIAWYWRCHKENLYKPFRDKGESAESAIVDCFAKMTEMLGVSVGGSDQQVPTGYVLLLEGEHDALILAQIQQEELDEYAEQSEFRYVQQKSLIESLQQEVSEYQDDTEEIERLKREAAALRKKQEAEDARRSRVRDILAKGKDDDEPDESGNE